MKDMGLILLILIEGDFVPQIHYLRLINIFSSEVISEKRSFKETRGVWEMLDKSVAIIWKPSAITVSRVNYYRRHYASYRILVSKEVTKLLYK